MGQRARDATRARARLARRRDATARARRAAGAIPIVDSTYYYEQFGAPMLVVDAHWRQTREINALLADAQRVDALARDAAAWWRHAKESAPATVGALARATARRTSVLKFDAGDGRGVRLRRGRVARTPRPEEEQEPELPRGAGGGEGGGGGGAGLGGDQRGAQRRRGAGLIGA